MLILEIVKRKSVVETFFDLDELVVLCKDKSAKQFIQEAVACYRVGAFRSCIVSTWNAVVFDFLHKLRQLDQTGNGDASQLLKEYEERIKHFEESSKPDVKGLWEFESSIPDLALKKFELISPPEYTDVKRLLEDRSRCAHPSMISLEQTFEATAELARYHLRSAVMHLLQHSPVQGKAALERIWQDIASEYFPKEPESAVKYFQKGPLTRARPSLIRSVVIGLTVSLLTEDCPQEELERQFSALNAISLMYPQEVGMILNDKLSDIIMNKVTDENWDKVVTYLKKFPVWEKLSEPCIIKARNFIQRLNITQNTDIILYALRIDFLRSSVEQKLQNASLDEILEVIDRCKSYQILLSSDLLDLANLANNLLQQRLPNPLSEFIDDFEKSGSYAGAECNIRKLAKVMHLLDSSQWERVLNAFCNNDQIHYSWGCQSTICSLFEESIKLYNSIQPYWNSFRVKLDNENFSHIDAITKLKQLIDSYSLVKQEA